MEVNMTKIMLVEDDKSLREIYGVRLMAEGYDIKSAGDGEEALAMAVKEHPDLILSDVMMPKISGFDMLDILRATPETKEIKVIMMTALSSEEQRSRGESLGADRYLVKSQVGIEDVVRTVHEVLQDSPVAPAPAASQMFGTQVPTASINTATPIAATQQFRPTQPTSQPSGTNISQTAQTSTIPQPTAPFSTPAPASLATQNMNPAQSYNPTINPATQVPRQPITPPVRTVPQPPQQAPRPFQAPQPTVQQPAVEPEAQINFTQYNPAMQPQAITPVTTSAPKQVPIQDISTLRQPTSLPQNTPNDVATMMEQELNGGNTAPNQPSNNPPRF